MTKVITPIVAMRGGADHQLYVDVLVPHKATFKLIQGEGPIHLVGSHCVNFYGYRDVGGDYSDDESDNTMDEETEEQQSESKEKKPSGKKESPAKSRENSGGKKRKASEDKANSAEKKKKGDNQTLNYDVYYVFGAFYDSKFPT